MYRTISILRVSLSAFLAVHILFIFQSDVLATPEPIRALPASSAYALHASPPAGQATAPTSITRPLANRPNTLGAAFTGINSGAGRAFQLDPALQTRAAASRPTNFNSCGASYESPPAAHMPPPDYVTARTQPAYGRSIYETGLGSEPISLTGPEIGTPVESTIAPIDLNPCGTYECITKAPWGFHLLPSQILFQSYLAGVHEPRIGAQWYQERDLDHGLWDSSLGGRAGLFRWGTNAGRFSEGIQLDVEGAAFPRMDFDPDYDLDVNATDFRIGGGLTFRKQRWEGKLSYYHLCAHLGDEYVLAGRPGTRINYIRDSIVLALGFWLRDDLRLYSEAGYAFKTDGGAEPWEFQFGFDWCTREPTGFRGAPFFAVNGHISEENNFSGHVTAQAGWAWRGVDGHLVRMGGFYYNGKDNMYEFHNNHVQQVGGGIWYDF